MADNSKKQSDWHFQYKALRWQTLVDGNKKKPLPDGCKAKLALNYTSSCNG